MPRSHVSIARFCDWSEDLGDCISVSKLYRDLANIPRLGDTGRGKNLQWCSNGVRVIPGRMFSRDKGALTKGEREIIAGIYRNRGENTRDVQRQPSPVRNHYEAWLVGRTISKSGGSRYDDTPRHSAHKCQGDSEFKVPDSLYIKSHSITDDGTQTSRESSCYFCAKERNNSKNQSDSFCGETSVHCKDSGDWSDEGPAAPPSTPDRLLQKRARAKGYGGSENSFSFSDSPESTRLDSPRRVRVNVYLPAMAAEQTEEDIKTCLLHGRSLLRKERPLSQSDFRLKKDTSASQGDQHPHSRPSTLRDRPSRASHSHNSIREDGETGVSEDKTRENTMRLGCELSE
ncbi:uncharacterized protein LOC124126337 isoform X2 [Haliotis rufescens]|nr:uncharacterized protein LOC124126337 isoform X2 [Haliotis rufescens]XP_046345718.2 uncharacterized protein LOC124126337 isoform X2 [Haliotis rufescens]XP_048240575.1 uncharacterized protein LOC124126337 isoform X2 [Haliotis rufescens]